MPRPDEIAAPPSLAPDLAAQTAAACPNGRGRVEEQVVALFDQFREPLLRYVSAFRLNPADAEEIVQEVFLSLFQRLKSGGALENAPTWIFGAAHNLALRRSNRKRRAQEVEHPAGAHVLADGKPNPEDAYARSELSVRLRAVVDSLSETDRRCIFMRAEGLRYREIARILDISLGSVALSLARSLARVARCAERCDR
jgi:RNA polymerase sigma-70 factor, ECF subfamily